MAKKPALEPVGKSPGLFGERTHQVRSDVENMRIKRFGVSTALTECAFLKQRHFEVWDLCQANRERCAAKSRADNRNLQGTPRADDWRIASYSTVEAQHATFKLRILGFAIGITNWRSPSS